MTQPEGAHLVACQALDLHGNLQLLLACCPDPAQHLRLLVIQTHLLSGVLRKSIKKHILSGDDKGYQACFLLARPKPRILLT